MSEKLVKYDCFKLYESKRNISGNVAGTDPFLTLTIPKGTYLVIVNAFCENNASAWISINGSNITDTNSPYYMNPLHRYSESKIMTFDSETTIGLVNLNGYTKNYDYSYIQAYRII